MKKSVLLSLFLFSFVNSAKSIPYCAKSITCQNSKMDSCVLSEPAIFNVPSKKTIPAPYTLTYSYGGMLSSPGNPTRCLYSHGTKNNITVYIIQFEQSPNDSALYPQLDSDEKFWQPDSITDGYGDRPLGCYNDNCPLTTDSLYQ